MLGEVKDKMAEISPDSFLDSYKNIEKKLEKASITEFSEMFLAEKANTTKNFDESATT